MRRRRRNRGSWFPVLPSYYGESTTGVSWTDSQLTFAGDPIEPGDTSILAIPLTFDGTKSVDQTDPGANSNSLLDFVQGQDYICERVVGNIWFNHPGYDGTSLPGQIRRSVCAIALAVLPVDDVSTQPSLDPADYNPLFAQNAQQPWLWRRVWQLADPNIYYVPGTVGGTYSGLREGTVLDTKGVKRRVTKEQRLFIIGAAGALDVDTGPKETTVPHEWGYDLRIFGGMRSSHNRSTFK